MTARLEHDRIRIGPHLAISFERTLRIPGDGRPYPLPPGLGLFPIRRLGEEFLIPMYQREALWIAFDDAWWKPHAVKVAIGAVDAITGDPWTEELRDDPQNYVVVPDQPWLDGINSGHGTVRQFVAMPLGSGATVEAELTGEERIGGLQFVVFEPRPGRFPDEEPEPGPPSESALALEGLAGAEMGLGAGGEMTQKIYPDSYGIEAWNRERRTSFHVRIVNSDDWRAVTGEEPPPTPVDTRHYAEAGLPWFALYDEQQGDVAPGKPLQRVRSVDEIAGMSDSSVDVKHVKKLGR